MTDAEKQIEQRLFELRDEDYRRFSSSLMPTVDPQTVIGVRTPQLRALAKELRASPLADGFLSVLPHRYYEENNLHGFLIEGISDYDMCVEALDRFLPFVDNWATCDLMRPKVFEKNLPRLIEQIKLWTASELTYTVRFGLEMLMSFYLDGEFKDEYLALAVKVKSEEYYVNMMRAWFFATALAKQYDATLPYIENRFLDVWTHNKTIQKAVESYRITTEQKDYLRSLKIKPSARTDSIDNGDK